MDGWGVKLDGHTWGVENSFVVSIHDLFSFIAKACNISVPKHYAGKSKKSTLKCEVRTHKTQIWKLVGDSSCTLYLIPSWLQLSRYMREQSQIRQHRRILITCTTKLSRCVSITREANTGQSFQNIHRSQMLLLRRIHIK